METGKVIGKISTMTKEDLDCLKSLFAAFEMLGITPEDLDAIVAFSKEWNVVKKEMNGNFARIKETLDFHQQILEKHEKTLLTRTSTDTKTIMEDFNSDIEMLKPNGK